jgi:hypothetical protein
LSVAGVDGPPPPAAVLDNFYKFQLTPGQSATIALNKLGGTGSITTFDLEDGSGNVLATGQTGPSNFTEAISNFVSAGGGTYYIHIHGNNINYGLTVTRDAAFDSEPNNSQATAQPLPHAGGAAGAVFQPGSVNIGASFDGVSSTSNTSLPFIRPPDGGFAVGDGYVVEAVNLNIRISDMHGNQLLQEPLATFFAGTGQTSAGGDPYVVYDDIANRWYVLQLDGNYQGVEFAVSNDANPLDGFNLQHFFNFGGLIDFPKMGFNADAVVITGNNFGASGTPLQGISIDKSQLLQGNLVAYTWQRDGSHFRAEVPAWMHGSQPGDPMYLVEEAGYGNGSEARVVTMTNILSSNPTFVDTNIPVDAYGFPPFANQPGGIVVTNDTTFTRADWRNGMLVSAQSVGVPSDGFSASHVRWYEFNAPTPSAGSGSVGLVQQGTVNPGPGISTYYGTAVLDANGDIGLNYMESSASEFVSMYVTARKVTDPLGTMAPGTVVAAGIVSNPFFDRAGDYSGIAVDPSNPNTFWAENEFSGGDIWDTHIASFTVATSGDQDFYSFAANANDPLQISVSLPGSSTGAQFSNSLSPVIQLYDPNGNLVDSGTTSLSYTALLSGPYAVAISGANGTQGEYFLQVQGSTALAPVQLHPGSNAAPAPTAPVTNSPSSNAVVSAPVATTTAAPVSLSRPGASLTFEPLLPVSTLNVAGATQNASLPSASTASSNPAKATPSNSNALDAYFTLFGHGGNASADENLLNSLSQDRLSLSGDVQNESE